MKRKIKITDRKTALIIGILLIIGVLGVLSIPEVNASMIRGFNQIYHSGNFFINISSNLTFSTNNISRMHITQEGNIGIRTTSPTNALEVNGDLMVYDEIKQSSNQNIINRLVNSGRKEIFTSTTSGFSQGAVPINTWMRPVMTNYSADYGGYAFSSGVFDGQNIWLVPLSSTKLVKVNPATGEMTNYSADYADGNSAFIGGVFDGQNIWLIPSFSTKLVKVNITTGKMKNYSADYGEGASSFQGGVFDGQNIWLVPQSSTYLVKVNPATGEMKNYSAEGYQDTNGAFGGGVFDGQSIWMIPYDSDFLVKLNPTTREITNYSQGYGNAAFIGGVFDGQSIWLVPFASTKLIKVNPATGEMKNYPADYGNNAFIGGVFDGQSIWLVPQSSIYLVKVNPATGEMTNYTHGYENFPFQGGVFDGQSIWLVPSFSTKLVKFRPQEFGIEHLFTTGNTTFGGSLIVGRTIGVGTNQVNETFNHIGNFSSMDDELNSSKDLFIEGRLEVDRRMYLTGGPASIVDSDVAENLLTEKGMESVLCGRKTDCSVKEYTKEIDYGDVVCIDSIQTIKKCTEANSRLVVGVISNTSVIKMGNNGKYGYPVAVAGVVWTKATNENGNISPGDLLVSSSKPGYAMKSNKSENKNAIGKSFDFCDKKECKILMFVALS